MIYLLHCNSTIHAFTMPEEVKKQIYVMPQNRMLFVYVEEPISKKAFIISF